MIKTKKIDITQVKEDSLNRSPDRGLKTIRKILGCIALIFILMLMLTGFVLESSASHSNSVPQGSITAEPVPERVPEPVLGHVIETSVTQTTSVTIVTRECGEVTTTETVSQITSVTYIDESGEVQTQTTAMSSTHTN